MNQEVLPNNCQGLARSVELRSLLDVCGGQAGSAESLEVGTRGQVYGHPDCHYRTGVGTLSIFNIRAWLRDNGDGTHRLITDPIDVQPTDIQITLPYAQDIP